MFRFNREMIMPVFLSRRMTVTDLARLSGVAYLSAKRAVEGEKVAAPIIAKIADTLGVDPMTYLDNGGKKSMSKKTIRITREDGTTKDVELSISESEKGLSFTYWGETDADAHKAFAQYFSQKQKAAE